MKGELGKVRMRMIGGNGKDRRCGFGIASKADICFWNPLVLGCTVYTESELVFGIAIAF